MLWPSTWQDAQHQTLETINSSTMGSDPALRDPITGDKIERNTDFLTDQVFRIGPWPLGPYPMSLEMVSLALWPTDILAIPSSHPAITSFLPRVNWKALPLSRELSTFFPLSRVST